MLPKTITENLDLILKYRTYTIQADTINLNGTVVVGGEEWPRYALYTTANLPYTTQYSHLTMRPLTVGNTLPTNTFANDTPNLDPAAYFNAATSTGSITFLQAGYYTITSRVRLVQIPEAGAWYAVGAILSPPGGPGEQVIGQEWVPTAQGPSFSTYACTFSRYIPANWYLIVDIQTSDSRFGAISFNADIGITKHK